jgi:hypothetical protein
VSTVRINQGAGEMTATTTTTVTGIEKKPIAESAFQLPAGLTRTESPLERMIGAVGK